MLLNANANVNAVWNRLMREKEDGWDGRRTEDGGWRMGIEEWVVTGRVVVVRRNCVNV
jgi:hypothetical protein